MSTEVEQAKEPVSAVLAGPYGHGFHPILVTVPIGAWVGSLVFDIARQMLQQRPFFPCHSYESPSSRLPT